MTSREAFRCLLDLLTALEAGQAPPRELAAWFVAGAQAWLGSSGGKPLERHLGITRRARADWLARRQARWLDHALRAFARERPGESRHATARAFVDRLDAFNAGRRDGSRIDAWLELANAIPAQIPRSSRHWWRELSWKPKDQRFATSPPAAVLNSAASMGLEDEMANEKRAQPTEAELRKTWDADAALRAEFLGDFDSWSAYARALADGRIS